MDFLCEREVLVRELALLQGAVSSATAIPALSMVHLEAAGDMLALTATDLDCAIRTSCSARVAAPGGLCLPARRLYEYVRRLESSEVRISLARENWASLVSGAAKARLAGASPESYPVLPGAPDCLLEVPLAPFLSAAKKIEFAISREASRFTLEGAQLEVSQKSLRLVATDGHRLALREIPFNGPRKLTLLLPRRALGLLQKLGAAAVESGEAADVTVARGDNHLFFSAGGRQLLHRELTGTFPDYQRILPTDQPHSLVVARQALADAIQRVDQFSDELSHALRLRVQGRELTLQSSVSGLGESEETLDLETEAASVEVGFNAHYLLEYLKAETAERVSFSYSNAQAAGEFRAAGADAKEVDRYVIMPMRL